MTTKSIDIYILFPSAFIVGFDFNEDTYGEHREETFEISFGFFSISFNKITIDKLKEEV